MARGQGLWPPSALSLSSQLLQLRKHSHSASHGPLSSHPEKNAWFVLLLSHSPSQPHHLAQRSSDTDHASDALTSLGTGR